MQIVGFDKSVVNLYKFHLRRGEGFVNASEIRESPLQFLRNWSKLAEVIPVRRI